MTGERYSLWVMPTGELYEALKRQIVELANRFKAPVFEPHVTLLGIERPETEITTQTEKLAQLITPYEIKFGIVDYTDNLFQSLVIRVEDTNEVIRANKAARNIFNQHTDSLYAPHLSLLYSTEVNSQTKEQLISELGDNLKGQSFKVNSIHIFTSNPTDINKWARVAEVPLTKQDWNIRII